MKYLVIFFLIFIGFLSYQLLTESSETADKELSRILTESDAEELKESLEKVVIRENKPSAIESTQENLENDPITGNEEAKHEELFQKFSQAIEKDEIEGLNLARTFFFSTELDSEVKNQIFDDILQSDISEENKKYLSREILKGPSDASAPLFEKALRNYTSSMLPEEKKEILNDLKEMSQRKEIIQILERFALDQGL